MPESEPARRILEAAAVMHDVGGKGTKHRKHGYQRIRGLHPPVGWNGEYLQAVAIVAHYHRGGLPAANHPIFAGLPARRRSELLPLAGVLRLANALDSTHDQRVRSLVVEQQGGVVKVLAEGMPATVGPYGERLARARYLLESCVRRPIIMRPFPLRRSAVGHGLAQES